MLKSSANGENTKITWVGSEAHFFTSLNANHNSSSTSILDYFDSSASFSGLRRYPDTKFLVALFVREMARAKPLSQKRKNGTLPAAQAGGVVINNLCPGTVATEFDVNLPFWMRIPMQLHRKVRARTVEEGARTLVYATAVAGNESHGAYIANNEVSE
jgi:NAD(P)-dependent dehydrogenase (short-subunit alcohol dehydrogenase family)